MLKSNRTHVLGAAALASALFASGCTYYVPAPQPYISRLTSDQMAAINSNDKLTPDEKKRLTDQNQQILTEQETLRREPEYRTVVVDPWYPVYPWYGPYYSPYYPFYPGISLSLGYVWSHGGGHGGHHGWSDGHRGRGGWGGGRGGGGHGRR